MASPVRTLAIFAFALALCGTARGEGITLQDRFTLYPPGSTGAPWWSILSGRLDGDAAGLKGPVSLRFNSRPSHQYTVTFTLSLPPDKPAEMTLWANMQHEKDTGASDEITVALREGGYDVTSRAVGPTAPAWQFTSRVTLAASESVSVRFVVDGAMDRHGVFIGEQKALTAPSEYAPGLMAFRISEGVRCTDLSIRDATPAELASVASGTLFNDPRDIAPGDEGNLLVLHRGDRAVLAVSPTGEILRGFGRRLKGHLTDPVALSTDSQQNVYVLNRQPAEVLVFNRNGRLLRKMGAGELKEPADVAVTPDGRAYVADPGAGRLVEFGVNGQRVRDVTLFGREPGLPDRVTVGPLGNLVVSLREPQKTVVFQPTPGGPPAVVMEFEGTVGDVAAAPTGLVAASDGTVIRWPPDAAGAAYRGIASGGLSPNGRLAVAGGRCWVLNRRSARIVEVPGTLADVDPKAAWAEPTETSAHVTWTSVHPSVRSRVQVKRGDAWDTFTEGRPKESREHHVLLSALPAGQPFTFHVSPCPATIPASDWSADFTLTPAAPSAP